MKTLTELVKDNIAQFVFFRDGSLFYDIKSEKGKLIARFPVDVSSKDEIGNASFMDAHKAITLMRYIRKAIKEETIFIY